MFYLQKQVVHWDTFWNKLLRKPLREVQLQQPAEEGVMSTVLPGLLILETQCVWIWNDRLTLVNYILEFSNLLLHRHLARCHLENSDVNVIFFPLSDWSFHTDTMKMCSYLRSSRHLRNSVAAKCTKTARPQSHSEEAHQRATAWRQWKTHTLEASLNCWSESSVKSKVLGFIWWAKMKTFFSFCKWVKPNYIHLNYCKGVTWSNSFYRLLIILSWFPQVFSGSSNV